MTYRTLTTHNLNDYYNTTRDWSIHTYTHKHTTSTLQLPPKPPNTNPHYTPHYYLRNCGDSMDALARGWYRHSNPQAWIGLVRVMPFLAGLPEVGNNIIPGKHESEHQGCQSTYHQLPPNHPKPTKPQLPLPLQLTLRRRCSEQPEQKGWTTFGKLSNPLPSGERLLGLGLS